MTIQSSEGGKEMKYIDAEKLIAEIESLTSQKEKQLKSFNAEDYTCSVASSIDCKLYGNMEVLSIIKSLQQEQPIKVYRVENEKEQKGLWRKFDGTWEPLFDMLTDGQCKDMPMDDDPIYREGGKQWFASAPSKETLQKWFSKRDLEELTAKGFTISEFEVIGHKKISDFEYIFTRDNIVNRTYLKVSDIYPQKQPLTIEKVVEQYKKFGGNPEVIQSEVNLEKEIGKYLVANFTNDEDVETPFLERRFAFWKDDLLRFAKHIAEWQKAKMMEGSFTTIMQTDDLGDRVPTLPDMAQYGYKEGDKVKVIIVKED